MRFKRLLFYCLLPIAVVLALVGFPMPVAPRQATKAAEEQSAPADKRH